MSDVSTRPADGRVHLDRELFERMVDALRFAADAQGQRDYCRASERAALLLIDIEAAAVAPGRPQ